MPVMSTPTVPPWKILAADCIATSTDGLCPLTAG